MEIDPKLEADIVTGARSSDTLVVAYAMLQVVKALREAKLDAAALHAIAKEIREGTTRIAQAIAQHEK
jgi:hypothetical protein